MDLHGVLLLEAKTIDEIGSPLLFWSIFERCATLEALGRPPVSASH